MKRLIMMLLCLGIGSASAEQYKIDKRAFFIPSYLSDVEIAYDTDYGFIGHKGDSQWQVIPSYNCSTELRTIDVDTLEAMLKSGYIKVSQADNGEIMLSFMARLRGGGAGGATAGVIIGKFLTYAVCYGGIYVASLITGPASGPTALAAGKALSPLIEIASNKVAIGCGILGGILTGPV